MHFSSWTALRAANGLKASDGNTMAEPWVAFKQLVDCAGDYSAENFASTTKR